MTRKWIELISKRDLKILLFPIFVHSVFLFCYFHLKKRLTFVNRWFSKTLFLFIAWKQIEIFINKRNWFPIRFFNHFNNQLPNIFQFIIFANLSIYFFKTSEDANSDLFEFRTSNFWVTFKINDLMNCFRFSFHFLMCKKFIPSWVSFPKKDGFQ
jgi:hypothetical protein